MSGLVSLVGAGPEAGLITLRGARRLSECEAVVYDELIPPELLRLVPEGAERINMGKRAGAPSARQEDICARLIALAREGKRVVRLKGGDAFVFGRGGEELLALSSAGVACEVVPGVTSAIAAPELAGIPLTHRGASRGFTVITASSAGDGTLPEDFDRFAAAPGTLCILMGLGKLGAIARRLMELGRSADTPCAVLRAGPGGYRVRGTLADIAARAKACAPPAVIVVGETAALELLGGPALPLSGLRVGLTGTRRMNARLAAAISRAGGEPFTACELELSPLPASDELGIDRDCIVFTSVYGVELYFSRLLASGRDARCLAGKTLACVGRSTARALAAHGLSADIVPGGGTTAALAGALLSALPAGAGIFLYRSAAADGSLAAALGAQFDVCDNRAYAARAGAYQAPRALIEGAAAFAFTSAHGAALALAALSPLPEGAVLAALGGPTARALAGLPGLVVAERPEAEALADAIIRAIKNAPADSGRA